MKYLEDLLVNKFNIIEEYYKDELKRELPKYKVNIYENYKEQVKKNPEMQRRNKINFMKQLTFQNWLELLNQKL